MKLYKPYTEKFETRNIVKKSSQLFDTYFQCEFVYTTIHYNIFGQPRKKVKSIIDQITFYTYDAAKDYIENVEKLSSANVCHKQFCQIVFPKNYKTDKYFLNHNCKTLYDYVNEIYLVVNKNCYCELCELFKSSNVKNIVEETKKYCQIKKDIVYSCENTKLGEVIEIKELENKRDNLIDSEIERSKQYIAFLEELKK